MTNIIDGMDAARFNSGTVKPLKQQQKKGKAEKEMPMVLKNLKNGS